MAMEPSKINYNVQLFIKMILIENVCVCVFDFRRSICKCWERSELKSETDVTPTHFDNGKVDVTSEFGKLHEISYEYVKNVEH